MLIQASSEALLTKITEMSSSNSTPAFPRPPDPATDAGPQVEHPEPSTANDWELVGQRHLQTGHLEKAIASFRRATELEPAGALHWERLGRALAAKWEYEAAELALQRACTLDPDLPSLHVALADVFLQQNRPEAAIEACRRALAVDPENLHAAVTEALMLPPIYAGTNDLRMWRNRFVDGLARLHARKSSWLRQPHGVLGVELTNFYLAYQGEDDCALQSSYSDFLAALLGATVPDLQAPIRQGGDRATRIKVGFMSSNLSASTIGDYFGSWITDLPRDRFEVSALLTVGIPDARTKALARATDKFVSVTGGVEGIARTAKSLELDILVLPDVGMSAWSSLLANLRLAPVQCAAWGHPVTTGSTFIDYFLSCADMEPAHASAHYREQLVLLPGLGTRYEPRPRVERAARDRFGLPPQKRIYLCPQSLYKIHPSTDALFLDVLTRDDDAVLLFFAATTQGQRQAFVHRLQAGMKMRGLRPRQQIKLLPFMSHRDFRRVMSVSDVMLDTPHWSGGATSLDALASGLPIVTLQGRFMRGRQSAAMLRIIGVEELIAHDAEQYVELALRVARDPAYREALSSRIRDRLPRLVNRSEPIEALAEAFESMARGRPPGPPYAPN
ncbi:MAG: tetratricopeptide repeat protein [Pseudomonadota bacterium]|nr:tetratricopeptide repeat protein [Pseudomonadota bacterium]